MSFSELMDHAETIQKLARSAANGPDRSSLDILPAVTAEEEALIEEIPSLYRPFSTMPDPASFDEMTDDLTRALGCLAITGVDRRFISATSPLSSTLETVPHADVTLADWTGDAAENFRSNFIVPFRPTVCNQFVLVAALKGALDAHKEMWARARADVDKLAHHSMDALTLLIANTYEWDWGVILTVAGAVLATGAAIVAALPTGGMSLAALSLTVLGTGTPVVVSVLPQEHEKAMSVAHLLRAMRSDIYRLHAEITRQEQAMVDKLTEINKVLGSVNRDLFTLARPALAEMANARAEDLTGDTGLGAND
ncbi:MAG TPA: hypothetical protein VF062_00430 [Candidatus Limnocylindrales bacterium]